MMEHDLQDNRVFLPQADQQLRHHVTSKSFRTDLLMRLLLEDEVVVPDIYFLISDHIENDLARRENSIVLAALEAGSLVAAFGYGDPSFGASLQHRRDVQTLGLRPKAAETAAFLDKFDLTKLVNNDLGRTQQAVAGQFRKVVEDVLLTGPSPDPLHDDLWTETASLRRRIFEKSLSLDTEGLRRSTVLRVIAEEKGQRGDPAKWRSRWPAKSSDQKNLEAMILWMNELYNFAQATGLQCRPSFPVTGVHGSSLMARAVQQQSGTPLPDTQGHAKKLFSHRVTWPLPQSLSMMNIRDLLSVKTSGSGLAYTKALSAFRRDPSETAAATLFSKMDDYAGELGSLPHGKDGVLNVAHSTRASGDGLVPTAGVVAFAGTESLKALALVSDNVAGVALSLITLTTTTAAAYQVVANRRRNAERLGVEELGFRIVDTGEWQIDCPIAGKKA